MKRGIIVSIQGYHQKTITELAMDAVSAGAVAIRTDKPITIRTGAQFDDHDERVPIIGLYKIHVCAPSREPYITSTLEAVQAVSKWADYVAVDYRQCNTERETISAWCKAAGIHLIADIETTDDWESIQGLHYDFVATTFSVFHKNHRPDIQLVKDLVAAGEKHIIAEGNYTTRCDVQEVLKAGAHAVCIGGAISNVYKLARKFTTIEF